jgi:hypothetical protein
MEEDAERPIAVEVLGKETIVPDGEASVRAEVEDISRRRCRRWLAGRRRHGEELAAAAAPQMTCVAASRWSDTLQTYL